MVISTMSAKNQTTIGKEIVAALGLRPGTQLRQTVEGSRLIIEPIGDIMSSFGVFKAYAKSSPVSIQDETDAAEQAIVEDVMKSMRNE